MIASLTYEISNRTSQGMRMPAACNVIKTKKMMGMMKGLLIPVVLLLILTPFYAASQNTGDIVRIENGMLIIRFDKRQGEECKKQLQYFGLKEDSVWNYKNIGALSQDGWTLTHIDKNIAEISKAADKTGNINWAQPLYLKSVPRANTPGYPGPVSYGVNNYKTTPTVFENKKDETVFVLRGNANARKVMLSGNFNNWSTIATPMQHTDSGWVAILKLIPGKYLYKFIVDGQWIYDMNNNKREKDGEGGYNSIYFHYNYTFTLHGYTNAKRVILAGSFNNWNEKELVMQRSGDGWKLPLFLNVGTHAYKFIVDGEWILDPVNKVTRPDGSGNFNSFMGFGDTIYFKLDGYLQAKSVLLSGNFNAWNTAELSMSRTKTGWEIPYVLAPGNYEYKFIVDGRWMADPANPLMVGDNDHRNSLRIIQPNYTFVLKKYPDAKQVLLSGSFNNWADPGYVMQKKDGVWTFPLYFPAGKYTYKFVVDGKWITDPDNKLYEENEFNTGNSVLWMEPGMTLFER